MFNKKCLLYINKYKDCIKDNEVLEIYKDGKTIVHRVIEVPGDSNE